MARVGDQSGIPGGGTVTSVDGVNSVQATPSPITGVGNLQLVGDVAVPADETLYGKIAGLKGWFNIPLYQTNGAPTVNDDDTLGFRSNYIWFDLNTGIAYWCFTAATGAAIWLNLVSSANAYYPSLTHAALLAAINAQTAANGWYFITARPSSGTDPLLVQVVNDAVNPEALVTRNKPARGSIQVDDNTGLTGTMTPTADAVNLASVPIAFNGNVETPTQIAANMAAGCDNINYTYWSVGDTFYYQSLPANGLASNGFVTALTNDSGNPLATLSLNNMSGGGVFDWTVEGYDFINDTDLVIARDTATNRFMTTLSNSNAYDEFPADSPSIVAANDLASGNISSFRNFVGGMVGVTAVSSGRVIADESNALLERWLISFSSVLDVSAVVDGSIVAGAFLAFGKNVALAPITATAGNEIINSLESNYIQEIKLAANDFDMNGFPYFNLAGIIYPDVAGTLKTITNGSSTTKFITILSPKKISSGLLVNGASYFIKTVQGTDDFTNVGFVAVNTLFVATGTTPTIWTNGTEVWGVLIVDNTGNIVLPTAVVNIVGSNDLTLERIDDADDINFGNYKQSNANSFTF